MSEQVYDEDGDPMCWVDLPDDFPALSTPVDEVLVEGSWFKRSDLPTILGNFMRSSAEYAREAKDAHIALAEAERRGAEKGFDAGYRKAVEDDGGERPKEQP